MKHVLGRDLKADPKGHEVISFHHWMAFYQINMSNMFCSHRFCVLSLDECCCREQKWLWEEKQLPDTEKTSNAHSI